MNKIEQEKRESVTSYYYADVNLYDVPTFEEEQELFKRIRNGDIEARNEIIERNLRFVVNIARQFIKANETLPFPDLIQDGNLGLIEAVDNFDYTLGYRFNTYSVYWIKSYIIMGIVNKSRIIRIPCHLHYDIFKARKIAAQLQKQGIEPTSELLAKELGKTAKEIDESIKYNFDVSSLDIILMHENVDDFYYRNESLYESKYSEECLMDKIFYECLINDIKSSGALTDREKFILIHRYNLDGNGIKTKTEIGKELDISRERVRQIEKRALEKLRNDKYISEYNLGLTK